MIGFLSDILVNFLEYQYDYFRDISFLHPWLMIRKTQTENPGFPKLLPNLYIHGDFKRC